MILFLVSDPLYSFCPSVCISYFEVVPCRRREREFKVSIKSAGRTDLHQLQQFLVGRQKDAPQDTLQVLDVVLRESPTKK